jgi:hypothetical protein
MGGSASVGRTPAWLLMGASRSSWRLVSGAACRGAWRVVHLVRPRPNDALAPHPICSPVAIHARHATPHCMCNLVCASDACRHWQLVRHPLLTVKRRCSQGMSLPHHLPHTCWPCRGSIPTVHVAPRAAHLHDVHHPVQGGHPHVAPVEVVELDARCLERLRVVAEPRVRQVAGPTPRVLPHLPATHGARCSL